MRIGMSARDITPRVGVDLAGFGPYLDRCSKGVRLPLWAKGLALEENGKTALIVNCELVGVTAEVGQLACEQIVREVPGLAVEDILITATHTHSGPSVDVRLNAWGRVDPLFLELLPDRIAEAGIAAVRALEPAEVAFGTAPCEHIGLNREYEPDAPPLAEVLRPDWRSQCPERTDTQVQVLKFSRPGGGMFGFAAYFGCHPVVCCQVTHWIHGDFPAVAMAKLQQEFPGSLGVFLQGAQGDINSCVVHKPEPEALAALEVIGERFAVSIRAALKQARPIDFDALKTARIPVDFSIREDFNEARLAALEADYLSTIHAPAADPEIWEVRMAMANLTAVRRMRTWFRDGEAHGISAVLSGLRLGPVALLGAPFEMMQEIKNEVLAGARASIPWVLALCNGSLGYAPDHHCAARGGYAVDVVPILFGLPPYGDIHTELVAALLRLDAVLFENKP